MNIDLDNTKKISNEKYGTVYFIPPNESLGYRCGFSLYIPNDCSLDTTLLVHACNTGKGAITLNDALDDAKKISASDYHIELGKKLHIPVLTPIIPRVKGCYTHFYGSDIFNNTFSGLNNYSGSNDEKNKIVEMCTDLHEQVANMIKSSKIILTILSINVEDKVIIEGFSAGSKFANGFTALHPELIKACIFGGNSGIGILPTKTANYPLGFKNIDDNNMRLFFSIPQLYYIGENDINDPAEVSSISEKGLMHPFYKECYTDNEVTFIHSILGENNMERFNNLREIYNSYSNFTFKKIKGEHEVDMDLILEYINSHIKNSKTFDSEDTKIL